MVVVFGVWGDVWVCEWIWVWIVGVDVVVRVFERGVRYGVGDVGARVRGVFVCVDGEGDGVFGRVVICF